MPALDPETRRCLMMQHINPGPGPGAYNLPSTFAGRYCEKEADDCGPGFYALPSTIGACTDCGAPDKKSSPRWTIRGRGCEREDADCGSPGPAAYSLPSMIGNICDGLCQPPTKPTAPAWTIKGRYCERESDACGPPFYALPSLIGACTDCGAPDKKSSPRWTMRGRGCEREDDCGSPGPAAYYPQEPCNCSGGPKWTIRGRPCENPNDGCSVPFYCIPSTIGACGPCGVPDKRSAPQHTFGIRHTEFAYNYSGESGSRDCSDKCCNPC